jgi:hypothetical protein
MYAQPSLIGSLYYIFTVVWANGEGANGGEISRAHDIGSSMEVVSAA